VNHPGDAPSDRVLVLAPSGRDAQMVRERLLAAELHCELCADLDGLLTSMASPAGAALVAIESLLGGRAEAFLAALEAQEPWSDLPVLLLTESASRTGTRAKVAGDIFARANVTLLERPLRVELLMSALRAAIRARRRQYQMRDLMRDLQRAVHLSDLFVSILGHDLRTPLGAIKLSAETIVRIPDSRAVRPAGRILSSADRMTRMIEQLLDFARVRQGHGVPLAPRSADLAELCRAVVQELEDAHPHAHITFGQAGSLTGEWDPDRIGQVISNLVANAVQHGASGTSIEVDVDGRTPDAVRVRVHNEGPVPDAVLPTLFEAFKGMKGNSAEAKAARSGLGLGLFIAQEIARAHGGNITVRTSQAEGTTFEVVLPRRTLLSAVTPSPLI
jgi:signal transduction histidine kinase